jgi:hypothetical protein
MSLRARAPLLPTRRSGAGPAGACLGSAGDTVADWRSHTDHQRDADGNHQPVAHGIHQLHGAHPVRDGDVIVSRDRFSVTDSDGIPAAPEDTKDPGLSAAVDFVTRVVAPASLLTAILYYFGYVRELALFGYFGVDLGSLQFSTTDYLVRSAGTIFLPVGTVLACGVLALLLHHMLTLTLSRAGRKWRRASWALTGTAAMALLILGVAGLEAPRDVDLSPVTPPVALGTGALLAGYTVYLAAAYASLPSQLTDTLRATRPLRRILIGALLLVSAFWATAVVAEQRGNAVAQAIEASLPVQPEAVVYSSQRLQITGPGITETRLSGTDAAFVFRYNGLRPLIHSGGHWFLLPAGWTHSNGATVIILPDTAPGIRVELGP